LGEHVVASECGAYGCTERFADGMGMFTRSFLGMDLVMAVPAMSVDVYSFAPPANLAGYRQLAKWQAAGENVVALKGFQPAHFNAMTAAEWQVVADAIRKRIADECAQAVRAPSGRGTG
jgi:hypothetical protein